MRTDAEKEEREFRQKLPGLKVDIAIKRVIATRDGRAVLRWILADTGLERSSFNSNALMMAYQEGRRSVGVTLCERLKRLNSDSYRLMQEESDE